MKNTHQRIIAVSGVVLLMTMRCGWTQDWPQWRGVNRDAKATGFIAPKTWPKEMAQKWKVPVGQADATPALVGDKLYVFARQGGDEVALCLDATTGKEVWSDKYAAQGATGPAAGHAGPRSSPTVVEGKVVLVAADHRGGGTVAGLLGRVPRAEEAHAPHAGRSHRIAGRVRDVEERDPDRRLDLVGDAVHHAAVQTPHEAHVASTRSSRIGLNRETRPVAAPSGHA